jgi:hypothetical protein
MKSTSKGEEPRRYIGVARVPNYGMKVSMRARQVYRK